MWVPRVASILRPPADASSGIRVMSLEICPDQPYGEGPVKINPFPEELHLPWPLEVGTATDDLVSYGIPLSLIEALAHADLSSELRTHAATYLAALVCSAPACDQLNRCRALPIAPHVRLSAGDRRIVDGIERKCKGRMGETGHEAKPGGDWTGWPVWYEVWFLEANQPTVKLLVRGVQNEGSTFDFGGASLTGGRVWLGAVLMARWILSQAGSELVGEGPLLELGAGTGILGVALASRGHRVVVSDREPALLNCMQTNIDANEVGDKCKVLSLHWEAADDPKVRACLRAQRFTAVIGSEVVYHEKHAALILGITQAALPLGGVALFLTSLHRVGVAGIAEPFLAAGCEVIQRDGPMAPEFQDAFCGAREPEQQTLLLIVKVPPAIGKEGINEQ